MNFMFLYLIILLTSPLACLIYISRTEHFQNWLFISLPPITFTSLLHFRNYPCRILLMITDNSQQWDTLLFLHTHSSSPLIWSASIRKYNYYRSLYFFQRKVFNTSKTFPWLHCYISLHLLLFYYLKICEAQKVTLSQILGIPGLYDSIHQYFHNTLRCFFLKTKAHFIFTHFWQK